MANYSAIVRRFPLILSLYYEPKDWTHYHQIHKLMLYPTVLLSSGTIRNVEFGVRNLMFILRGCQADSQVDNKNKCKVKALVRDTMIASSIPTPDCKV